MNSDDAPLVSFITPLELDAAICRRMRGFSSEDADKAFARNQALQADLIVLKRIEMTIRRAKWLIASHRLRAADALQLASAMIAREEHEDLPLVTLDQELRAAALAEGFTVLPELSLP